MTNTIFHDKIELTELANKLFMYTDAHQWQQLLDEVFTEEIWFDMSSAGAGEPSAIKAQSLCDLWNKGFENLDQVHHQAGHYLIDINEKNATVFGYAIATHYKEKAAKGKTRTFVGSYDLKAVRTANGWRLSQFKYNLKYIDGNITLE